MRKINCDRCDKKVEDYITYVYSYNIYYLTKNKYCSTIDVALQLCKKCYPDIKSGKKKPKPLDQVIDIAWVTGYE